MKSIKIFILSLMVISFSFIACNEGDEHDKGPVYTSADRTYCDSLHTAIVWYQDHGGSADLLDSLRNRYAVKCAPGIQKSAILEIPPLFRKGGWSIQVIFAVGLIVCTILAIQERNRGTKKMNPQGGYYYTDRKKPYWKIGYFIFACLCLIGLIGSIIWMASDK